MTDFETHPVGTAAELAALRARLTKADELAKQAEHVCSILKDDNGHAPIKLDQALAGYRESVSLAAPGTDEALIRAALEAAFRAVNATAAPVVGTPYSVGGGLFSDAIRAIATPEGIASILERAKG